MAMFEIPEGATVLFQGDSITDSGRMRAVDGDLGVGYPLLVSALYSSAYPERGVRFLNRGVSGDRLVDLEERWEDDCLALRPDALSILIGVNETWRAFDSSDPTPAPLFERRYRDLLARTQSALPDVRIALIEPFLLPFPDTTDLWRVDLNAKIAAVRRVARDAGCALVPLDGLFAAAATRREPAYWAEDGIHPTPAGHGLIARAWLAAFGVALE
jgi:lysophospholipase L1-like esterase